MADGLTRRDLLKVGGAALAASAIPAQAKTRESKSKPPNLKDLLERGEPEIYSGNELTFIGLPIGGLFSGTVYLGGDGQLWNWDVFNQEHFGCVERQPALFMGDSLSAGEGANYVAPVRQQSPFAQSFRLMVVGAITKTVRFGDIRFRGEYPIGRVTYSDADADVEMSLEAFSPFCPLDVENSAYPATTMTFTVTNKGSSPLALNLHYASENPVLIHSRSARDDFQLKADALPNYGVQFSASRHSKTGSGRSVLFEDWSSGSYGKWKTTGTAFGDSPRKVSELPGYMGDVNAGTTYVVNSHQTRNGENVNQADAHLGTLRSPNFTIDLPYINMRVGGGDHKGKTCINLVVDGEIKRTCTGHANNRMGWESFNVSEFKGKEAYLEVVDQESGPWGNISLGEVVFADEPRFEEELESLQDFGTFCICALDANEAQVNVEKAEVGRNFNLNPGQSERVTFIVAWHFPNCAKSLPGKRQWYASRWKDANAVASEIASRWPELQAKTRDWNKTWYDSTLPYWFLDRTFINTSILATSTCHRLDEGRFYFWEGVGCCAGTCTHVYGYAQAVGRVFPEVERYLRKEIDFGRAFHKDTGAIDYRAEFGPSVATDGQASCILRTYREHLMSPDDGFLRSIWPQVKGATSYLIAQDAKKDGILTGAQYNTLDTAWYGEIAWISSLYIAALRASEAMAVLMSDPDFAKQCGDLATVGSDKLVKDLFNGEYFINKVDPAHPEANNTNVGCHIDQIYGQSWALQVGLPRIVPERQAVTALKSLFKYNFYEDVWEYRRKNKAIPGGRWYATPKEAGLIMCSFPRGGADAAAGKGGDAWAVGYFNECMTGFEYQAAAHMIAEGLLFEGLSVVNAIHQRYHPSKRNPYNEIECSDHYGRAMASYGAYVSLTGFYANGPGHEMTFHPKASGAFRCALINPSGWGTYTRASNGKELVEYKQRVAFTATQSL
ncbi:MAG TPA: GH116 family glycosyl hydrolase [Fimbriimonadaceae bacterium]|jgi:uncharacterized protein (DUF608 family)